MSTGPASGREVAYRLFAAEYNDAEYSYSESEEERAPNYVITPTGARANRVFVVGVLTEVEQVGDDILRGRVVDPTGAFVLYAGQYQPDEQAFLEAATPPTFVAVTGKARTFEPEDSDQVFTSIRPESINEVDADTRDRWTVQAAERTLERIGGMATACSLTERGKELEQRLRSQGLSERDAQGIALAVDYYGTTPTYLAALRDIALDATGVVTGETDEVEGLSASPDEHGTVTSEAVLESLGSVTSAQPVIAEDPAADSETDTAETVADSGAAVAETDTSPTTPDETPPTTVESEPTTSQPVRTEAETGDTEVTEPATAAETDRSEPPAEPQETAVESDTADTGSGVAEDDDIGDFDPAEFDIPEEEREQVKEEFGTEFQSGTEVEEPGEADIETPEPPVEEQDADSSDDSPAESEPAEPTEEAAETASETAVEEDDATTEAAGEEPDDVQETVVEVMRELNDGTGADRDELIAEMNSRYGLDASSVEDAIEDALMAGQCYEPDDSTVTPI